MFKKRSRLCDPIVCEQLLHSAQLPICVVFADIIFRLQKTGKFFQRKTKKGTDGVNYRRKQLNQVREDATNRNLTEDAAARRNIILIAPEDILIENRNCDGRKLALELRVGQKLATLLNKMQKQED